MKILKNMMIMMNSVRTEMRATMITMQTKNRSISGNISQKMSRSSTMQKTLTFYPLNLKDIRVSKTASAFNANMMQLKITK